MPFLGLATSNDLTSVSSNLSDNVNDDKKRTSQIQDIHTKLTEYGKRVEELEILTDTHKREIELLTADHDKRLTDHEKRMTIHEKDIKMAKTCTMMANGIHLCENPIYETVIQIEDISVNKLFQKNETQDICVSISKISDWPTDLGGTGEFPSNNICFSKGIAQQYADGFVKSSLLKEIRRLPTMKMTLGAMMQATE